MFEFIRRFRRISAVLFIALTLIFTLQKANAYDPAGWEEFLQSLATARVAAAAAGGALAATGGIVATGAGTVLGLTPIGWAGLGLAVLVVVMVSGDSSGNAVAVSVASQDLTAAPNPDLNTGGQKNTTGVIGYYALAPVTGGILQYINDKTWTSPSVDSLPGGQRLRLWLANRMSFPDSSWGYLSMNMVSNSYVPNPGDSSAYNVGRCPSTSAGCVTVSWTAALGTTKAQLQAAFPAIPPFASCITTSYAGSTTNHPIFTICIPLVPATSIIDCDASTSYYDYQVEACVLNNPSPAPLADHICNVSWTADGCPAFNQADPDCQAAGIKLSCGTATAPPSVVVTDPATGATMTTERPVFSSQGSVGSVTAREATPDPVSGTTTVKVTTTSPATTTSPPTTVGGQSTSYAGTGATTGTSALTSVSVSNWPSTVNVTGTVTCANCSNQAPVVNVPDKMKIDGEVPSEYSSLPSAPSDLPDSSTLLTKLQARLAAFGNFQLPSHTSSCPAIDIHWHAWALNVDESSNYMCELLEQNRTLVQGLMTFVFIGAAILIVLGA